MPRVDRAVLAADYHQSAVSREPDTFVLYRIIGNDLPPRHAIGQSLRNLRFILENEAALRDCQKRFVVNRIVDRAQEAAVLALLEQAGVPYIRIPFDAVTYRKLPWDIEGVPVDYATWTARFAELPVGYQRRALMRLYRHKNNYVMNVNGARNAALKDGRQRAKWVLPWDGNCFVTEAAWASIHKGVIAQAEYPYHTVPMARITDNSSLFDTRFLPEANEEPQIIFRSDSREGFDERFHYGRRDKVELLWRLGVPGAWDQWPIEPWDLPCPAYVPEAVAWGQAGWVARLYSGQGNLEADRYGSAFIGRGLARTEAIESLLDQLDDSTRTTSFDRRRTCLLSDSLVDMNAASNVSDGLRVQLRDAAEQALNRGPYSVVHKTTLPPSGDRHDYWRPARYSWPHRSRVRGRSYVRRDDRRVRGADLYGPASNKYDRARLQRMFDDTFVLALAWRILGSTRYAEHAARLVRTWFLEPQTVMNPHLQYAQVRWGDDGNKGSGCGIIDMKDLYFFLDAVRLLERGDFLSERDQQALMAWFGQYLEWLRTSRAGRDERGATNNHGTYYDLQVAAIASYLGDTGLLRDTLRDSRSRVLQQFDADGAQPQELKRTNTAHYCCFNLQGWLHLALLADACGEDLWTFEGQDGRGIRRGMAWLLSHVGRNWPYAQIDEFDTDRFAPLSLAYAEREGAPAGTTGQSVASADRVSPLLFPHDGVMPFWQLAYRPIRTRASTVAARRSSMGRLRELKGRHNGERGVLVANGPSLNDMDLSFLRGETVIGLNKIYLGVRRFGFYPRYLVAVNQKVLHQAAADIAAMTCVKFIGERGADVIPEDARTYHIATKAPLPRFCTDIELGVHEGWTVTYAALQIAYYLGFREIVIIGMDHRFDYSGEPNETRRMDGPDPNHFSPDYFSGELWDNPDLARSEESYHIARQVYEADGRRIIDATVGGACQVFEKADYRDLFQI